MADQLEAMLFLLVGLPWHLRSPVWVRLPPPPGGSRRSPPAVRLRPAPRAAHLPHPRGHRRSLST
eukprot:10168069-Alexandrium_andersonii.AAC.1